MSWLNHPKFQRVRQDVIDKFRTKALSFRRLEHIVFLCGAAKSRHRDRLAEYLKKFRPDCRVFYADDVWQHIVTQASQRGVDRNALEMEAELARLADMVAIVVESPGTFAELGAFSMSSDLRKKLLPILDSHYVAAASFINTGPVHWVDGDSLFRPSISVDFTVILSAVAELEDRINRIPRGARAKVAEVRSSQKHMVFFLCDLVAVLGPITAEQLAVFVDDILGPGLPVDVVGLLGVASALRLVQSRAVQTDLFYLPTLNENPRPYTRRKFFDVSIERSKVLAKLQQIDEARPILALIGQ